MPCPLLSMVLVVKGAVMAAVVKENYHHM